MITRDHNAKMAGMKSINTSTVNNDFCKKMAHTDSICGKCYARNAEKFYSQGNGCVKSWVENGNILSTEKNVKYRTRYKVMRFHAFGELINVQHLLNFFSIARQNPNTTFTLWSKRKDIVKQVYENKPANMILIYSTLKINEKNVTIPIGFDKCFNVYSHTGVKELNIKINCGAKECVSCMTCYKHDTTNIINEKIKREKK